MVFQRVISKFPPNIGVEVTGLNGDSLDQQQMFLRCNFPVPFEPPKGFDVSIPGRAVRAITPDRFHSLREVSIDMVLECAGNGRTLMSPVPDGTAWELGGASPITVAGVRLFDVLGELPGDIVELVFTGADGYQFSIDRELYDSRRPLLATHIEDEPLDIRHGAPVRLIVPGHYGMKSVKWLTRIDAVTKPFRGEFVDRYRYFQDPEHDEGEAVADIAVRSVISTPSQGNVLPGDEIDVRGAAWTGTGEVEKVEVSVDDGQTWIEADLVRRETGGRFAPVRWAVNMPVTSGEVTILARAHDSSGGTQPLESRWNRYGYGNNVVHRVKVIVT